MPVLRSTLLSAGAPGYGTLLSLVERAGLYALIEQATTPTTVRHPLVVEEGADLAEALARFERLRAELGRRGPELPRPRHVIGYLAALETATAPLVAPAAAPLPALPAPLIAAPALPVEPALAPVVELAPEPLDEIEALAAFAETPLEEEQVASAVAEWSAIVRPRRGRRTVRRRAVPIAPAAVVSATPDPLPMVADLPTPAPSVAPEPAPAPEPLVRESTPRLSVDEIIARVFGRRPAPELPPLLAGPMPATVTPATVEERRRDSSWASQPCYALTAEIAVDEQGLVRVLRGSGEGLPTYLPTAAGMSAEVAVEGGELLLLDLLAIDGRDLRREPLYRRYRAAAELAATTGIALAPLFPHPYADDGSTPLSVRDLRAAHDAPGSWITAR